ncbi:hypothetical protein AAHD79_11040 [Citrobacter freundii]|uniref:hypothetical protein n=1 Tax=Citrobacter TaxID=544 RepID=UPI00257660C6|nr:hypothetical protein [Citrobacter sp. Cf118]MDM3162141.1 hypothetical protein [Citrobacter sp. Cf118]HBV2907961.1 hypothetical protein [Citrobacter freundii]
MGKVLAPNYKVCYRTADQVSRVKNELAGSFMYFAEAQDAMDTGLFCQKILIPVWELSIEERSDFLGKRYKTLSKDSLSPSDYSQVA